MAFRFCLGFLNGHSTEQASSINEATHIEQLQVFLLYRCFYETGGCRCHGYLQDIAHHDHQMIIIR